jgi:hypothetical protein
MPGRSTRKRTASQTRANKKHANNVARVLKNKLTKLVKKQNKRKTRKLAQKERKRRERESNEAMRIYENQEHLYNAPENHYPENIERIASLMVSPFSAPVRSKAVNNSNFYNRLERSLGMKSRKRTGNHTPKELLVVMKMNANNLKKRGFRE